MRLLSIIVPVLNEAKAIDGFLSQLDRLPGNWEAVFADGGSSDGTYERIAGRYKVLRCPKGRAVQMNAAARCSGGDVLIFLHCDSILPRDLCRQVWETVERGYAFGCFRIRFDSARPLLRCCALLSNLRVRLRKIAFGDQGIFLTRDAFERVGGFPEMPIMEDYRLSLTLKGVLPLGQARGYIVTSARRFEHGGALRTIWRMQLLQHRFRKGVPIDEIARQYKDIR